MERAVMARINQFRQQALYPALYPWLVGLAVLDVLVTWLVLGMGGREINFVARAVIDLGGVPGMAFLKLVTLIIVLGVCEYVGRREHRVGRRLAEWAVVANTIAVTMGCVFISQYWLAILAAR
jgi:hypothetical protein